MRERGREETCVQERMERGGGRAGTGASRTRRRYEEQKRIPPYIADVARHGRAFAQLPRKRPVREGAARGRASM